MQPGGEAPAGGLRSPEQWQLYGHGRRMRAIPQYIKLSTLRSCVEDIGHRGGWVKLPAAFALREGLPPGALIHSERVGR